MPFPEYSPLPEHQQAPNVLTATGLLDPSVGITELHLTDGQVIRLPTAMLNSSGLDASAEQIRSGNDRLNTAGTNDVLNDTVDDALVIPLIEERLEVGKRTLTTGRVRLHKTVQEFEAALDEPLAVRTFDIERVVLNQPVENAPGVRHEGDTTVYPLIEEQLILTKQLVLKEEIRVTRRDTERRDTQVVTLRREHIAVERENLRS